MNSNRIKFVFIFVILTFIFSDGSLYAAVIGQLGVLDDTANGGINPATNQPWADGDQYRLVFVTSQTTNSTSTNIADYNAFVQGIADAAGLGGVTWNVIGSTATVDARDNTGTNPAVDGAGVATFLLDGVTKVSDNNADMWDGDVDTLIQLGEDGNVYTGKQVLTGSDSDGTKSSIGRFLGNDIPDPSNGSPLVVVGHNSKTLAKWVNQYSVKVTGNKNFYALSEVLTVSSFLQDMPSVNAGGDWINWSGQVVDLAPEVTNNDTQIPQRPLSFLWAADPSDGVEFIPNANVEAPDVRITKAAATGDATVVTLTLAVTLEGNDPVLDTATIDVYDTSCDASDAAGSQAAFDSTDFNMDCITDIQDLAEMIQVWLFDYSLSEPKPRL